ncbi:MAG TPA: HD domain-containing phosphohydrolase [Candidatus Nanopelagicales bacterium]|nr:HD domain-containing phosphohydrolase [Candidatus Nanopelagicales bacterium]
MSRRTAEIRVAVPLQVAAGLVVIASVAITAAQPGGISDIQVPLAFAGFIAVGEILRIVLPGGRQAAPLASAGALAFALLPGFHGADAFHVSVPLAVSVVTFGSVIGAVPRTLVGRGLHLDELARRVFSTAVAAAIFQGLLDTHVVSTASGTWTGTALALAMTAAAIVAACVDAFLAAFVRSGEDHVPLRTAISDEFRALVGISSAIAATGVLIALAAPKMGFWALPVFAIPLLLTQFSFRRYATIDATYLQTIRSLSKVTEVGGYNETGHSRRVSRLAVSVGREMGIPERDLVDLEYAALMHDIGQLSLPQPIPGGTTTILAAVDQRRIAELGAVVIREAGMERAALIVERQSDPYRPHRGQVDHDLPLESRIVKVANAYDDFVGASLESDRKLQAIERLELAVDRDYDPAVVDVLARIVERQTEYAY